MQSKVFLAEDALEAFIDRAHPKHLHASAFFRYFAQEHCLLYTNISIIIETYQKISQNINERVAKDFTKALSYSNIIVLSPETAEMNNAMKVVIGTTDLGLQEALTLVMAEKRGIREVCTFSQLHQLFGIKTFFLPV